MTSAPASCGPVYLDGRPLAPEDEATLCSLLVGLPRTRSEIYTKPDLELALKAPGSDFVLSVFLGPGLLCAGHYLELWEQRMKGGHSDCLALTPEARALFSRLR